MKELKKAKWLWILISALTGAVGVLLILWPEISALVLCIVIGVLALAAGVLEVAAYFIRDKDGAFYGKEFAWGLFAIVFGVLLLLHPKDILAFFPVVLGGIALADSIIKVQISIDLLRSGVKSWWLLLAFSLVCGTLGFLVVLRPFEAEKTLMIVLGIGLLADCAENVCALFYLRNRKKEGSVYVQVDVKE